MALAQNSFSAHSGWNFSDTLAGATDVVVAQTLTGSGLDNGTLVTAQARLRIERVLAGSLAPGVQVPVEWSYRPGPIEPPAASTKVPAIHALWFLVQNGGKFEPLRASATSTAFGGFFLEVPGPQPQGNLFYPLDAPLPSKLAREVALCLEDLTSTHAADFAPHAPQAPSNGILAAWVQTRTRFDGLLGVFDSLPRGDLASVYHDFLSSPSVELRLLAYLGRAGSGDLEALNEMEPNLTQFASAYDAPRFTTYLMGIDLAHNAAAAHALGRMALSEITIPGLENAFAARVPTTHNPAFLPYLMVMLASPDPSVRGSSLMSFCNLLGPAWIGTAKPSPLWRPEMANSCPSRSPVGDAQQEQHDIQFWNQWWAEQRDEILKTTMPENIEAPPRYQVPPRSTTLTGTQVPIEVRFESLLHMAERNATHMHSNTGEIINTPPPPIDPISPKLEPADRRVFQELISSVNAKLAANQERTTALMNAARIKGGVPSREQMQPLWDERQSILKTGVQDLRNSLSPAGWGILEEFLNRSMGAAVVVQTAAPAK